MRLINTQAAYWTRAQSYNAAWTVPGVLSNIICNKGNVAWKHACGGLWIFNVTRACVITCVVGSMVCQFQSGLGPPPAPAASGTFAFVATLCAEES